MGQDETTFQTRVNRIESSYHLRAANGVRHEILSDGLIVARPRRRAPRFPWRGIGLTLLGLLALKVLLLVNAGPNVYNQRVDLLRDGSVFEQFGAWVMQADWLTRAIAEQINTILRSLFR